MSALQVVEQVQKKYKEVFDSGKVSDLVQFYSRDARYMAPGIPTTVGTESLKAAFDKYFKNTGCSGNTKINMTNHEAHEAGNFIFATGDYSVTTDGKENDAGKWVTVFKQEDGKWKIYYDIFCSN